MPVSFAAPTFARQGVVEGFVLAAPVFRGVSEAIGAAVYFSIYNTDITLWNPKRVLSISKTAPNATAGYEHQITIGARTYGYVQQVIAGGAPDTILTIATDLANQINSYDPEAYATASAGGITLAPRRNTGEVVACSAPSEGGQAGMLTELVGNELIPTLTRGVLFAQGVMYAPVSDPAIAAAPASQKSYLYYHSGTGFYWSASSTPTVSDDAYVGWVVTTATEIIAISSRKIGTGEEAVVRAASPSALAINTGAGADLGPPVGTLGWDVNPYDPETPTGEFTPGQIQIANVGWTGPVANLGGVDALTFLLYYANLGIAPAATLTAPLTSGATAMSQSALLAAVSPVPVTFTFVASGTLTGGVVVGPGYAHNITIGDAVYAYVQQTADTAADVAANLAALCQAAVDPHAMAVSKGAVVTLIPMQNNGATVICTATDGNTPATLTETQPSYYLIDSEMIAVSASTSGGATIARGQKGSTAAAHASGAAVWPVSVMTLFEVWNCAQLATAATITTSPITGLPVIGMQTRTRGAHSLAQQLLTTSVYEVPFNGLTLVAMDGWASNEYGASAVTEYNYGAGIGAAASVGTVPPPVTPGAAPTQNIISATLGAIGYTQQADGTWDWGIDVSWVLEDLANSWYSHLTVQSGNMVGGVWTPLATIYGTERLVTTQGRIGANTLSIAGWGILPSATGPAARVAGQNGATFRFRLYHEPMQPPGTVETGMPPSQWVLQTCWAGSADHADATPVVQTTAIRGDNIQVGGGVGTDAAGNLVVRTGATVGLDVSGNIIIPAGVLTNVQFASGISTVVAVYGLPALPSTSYPSGCIIINLSDGGKLYRNIAGVWKKDTDPADLVAGTLAAGVVYAGAVNASQITAGTISVAITLTSPTIQVSGSTFTVNIDSTVGIKVSAPSYTCYTQIENVGLVVVGTGGMAGVSAAVSYDHISVQNGSAGVYLYSSGQVQASGVIYEGGVTLASKYAGIGGVTGAFNAYLGFAVQGQVGLGTVAGGPYLVDVTTPGGTAHMYFMGGLLYAVT